MPVKAYHFFFLFFSLPAIAFSQTINTYAGTGAGGYTGDGGPAILAHIGNPGSGIFDNKGNYYFISPGGSRAFRIDTGKSIHFIAGTGIAGYNGDSILATTAKLKYPGGIAVDTIGNIYISEGGNNRVRKIDAVTGIITTIAGTGIAGYNGDGILAVNAQLNDPQEICFDKFGNLYICDLFNDRVRKVNPSGIISTIIGNGTVGYSGDGAKADTSKIDGAYSVVCDDQGNIFISSNMRIIKVNNLGIMNTIAGTGLGTSYDGDDKPATTAQIGGSPAWVKFDKYQNLFIADRINHRVRKIDASGIIHTVAGNGTIGYGGDGGFADSAQIADPNGLAIDTCGNLYIPMAGGATGFNRIRKVTIDTTCGHGDTTDVVTHVNEDKIVSIYPSPASNILYLSTTIHTAKKECFYQIIDLTGRVQLTGSFLHSKQAIDISSLVQGVYFMQIRLGQENIRKKFVKE